MEFSRQEYWSGLPFPFPEGLPDPGVESMSPALAGGFFTNAPPGKPILHFKYTLKHRVTPRNTEAHILCFLLCGGLVLLLKDGLEMWTWPKVNSDDIELSRLPPHVTGILQIPFHVSKMLYKEYITKPSLGASMDNTERHQ